MADRPEGGTTLPGAHEVLLALRDARTRLEAAERRDREPIAIVGLGGRWPGAPSPDAFWDLLHDGVDATSEVPADRWNAADYYDPDPDAPGRSYVRRGGFMADVDRFDAGFFGIAPREAASLDPQHRLLLEVSWEALEHAGLPPDRLVNSPTGVFVGISSSDYALLALHHGLPGLDPHVSTGNGFSAAAGRLSHVFGFQGPCLAVDTACSASLVAVHLACQALRSRECDIALAAGVNLILTPDTTVALSRMRVLAPDGRCKTFSSSADGMARGEGCGVLVLKRLSDALRDGDRILASIRGSAVNHDGASSGFTVPNGPAQQALIRRALHSAGVLPGEVSYVEAHGTGTFLGDPIEIGALGAVFGPGRDAGAPLVVGSVKTNVGHLEAAAGIAGVVKVVLALRHGEIPAHLHFESPNPLIPWSDLPLEVPTRSRPWPAGERPRRAGVSSFGLSGTNAHVVIEEAPQPVARPAADRGAGDPAAGELAAGEPHLLLLSAKSDAALRALAARYVEHLAGYPGQVWSDVCHTARVGRQHFRRRLSLVASSGGEARDQLEAYIAGRLAGDLWVGVVGGDGGRPGKSTPALVDDRPVPLRRLAEAYVHGDDVEWGVLDLDPGSVITDLPTYPFEPQRYWLDSFGLVTVPPATVTERGLGSAGLSPASRGLGAAGGLVVPDARSARMLGRTGVRYPRPPMAGPLVAPRTELETTLAELWQDALGIDRVGVDDDFYELGGDSVLAAQIVAQLRVSRFPDLAISRFLEAGTITRLAESLAADVGGNGEAEPARPIQAAPAPGPVPAPSAPSAPFPLSPDQERLWLLDRLYPGNAAYHVPAALRLRGVLDTAALDASLNALLRRHTALRTVVVESGGSPVQQVLPWVERRVEVADLRSLPPAEREARAQALADEEARAPFDLSSGPLVRVRLVRLDDADHLLLLTVHHIVADAWSAGIALQDLLHGYASAVAGGPAGMAEPVLQLFEHLERQQAALPGVLARQLPYWVRNLVQPTPVLNLPADRPRPAVPTLRGGHQFFVIPPGLHAGLRALSREGRCSLFVTLLAAFDVLLFRCSGQADVLVGCPVANRLRPDTARTVGFLANTLVMRSDLSGDPAFTELLGRVRQVAHTSYDHQDVPLSSVVEAVRPQRGVNYNPLFQVMLSVIPVVEPPPGPLAIAFVDQSPGASDYDLFLTLWEGSGSVRGALGFNADLFDPETAAALADGFLAILEQVVHRPETRLSDLALPEPLAARLDAVQARDRHLALIVAATFTAEPLQPVLDFWLRALSLPFEVTFAPYHQVMQQLLDPAQALRRNHDGVNLLLLRLADWWRDDPAPPAEAAARQDRLSAELVQAVAVSARETAAPLLVYLCPFAGTPEQAAAEAALAAQLEAATEHLPHVTVVRPEAVADLYPVHSVFDPAADRAGHVPFTQDYFAAMATSVARTVYAVRRAPYKVIVVDCDNTLWRGVCGEDGPENVTVDPARRRFQELLVAQAGAGMLVCLCSKNNAADVWAVFERGPEMPLRREHLAAWQLSWRPKPDGLRALAAELGLGLDSFVFVDDNPVECAEMRAACPAVVTLAFPAEADEIDALIRHTWAFDTLAVTAEDLQRTERYQQAARRRQAGVEASSLADFVDGLQLQVSIAPARASDLARVEQQLVRTNQFNATTRRLTQSEIGHWLANGGDCLVVRVQDRFGDYGQVGVVLCMPGSDGLLVDGFVLSCRALGKGVEHRMLANLGALAVARGLNWVEVRFVPSDRNEPARAFLDGLASATRLPDRLGSRYRIMAGDAAALVYRPEAGVVPAVGAAEDSSRPASPARPEAELIAHIPSTLRQVADIVRTAQARSAAPTPVGGAAWAAPQTGLEQAIAAAWQAALGTERVGLHDNFFDLGGHSFLLVQVSSQLQAALGREIPLVTLFQYPTVEALARHFAQGPAPSRALALGQERGRRQRALLVRRGRAG